MRRFGVALLLAAALCATGCGDDDKKTGPDVRSPETTETDGEKLTEPGFDASVDIGPIVHEVRTEDFPYFPDVSAQDLPDEEIVHLQSCNFGYAFAPWTSPPAPDRYEPPLPPDEGVGPDHIAWADPDPPETWLLPGHDGRGDLVMPGFSDNMPLFARGEPWNGAQRCFETPDGAVLLTEEQAWQLYVDVAQKSTGLPVNTAAHVRTVLGIRGSSPGTFQWNGNTPNRFNDTLVLIWRDDGGNGRVREFAAHTDTGPYDFGWHSSSSLRPNRRYRYINGWHKDYNALKINEWEYQVRDDNNKNGHWDSDRNGWMPPAGADDHDRTGSGHNIHCASVNAPLYSAAVSNWSAGCQVIPGIASWTAFITAAWTGSGDSVDYFLIDSRDIDPTVWHDCTAENGTHECPFRVKSLPFQKSENTAGSSSDTFDQYNCSTANESGPEHVYVLDLDSDAFLHIQVDDTSAAGPDIDVHLLDGSDASACLMRDNISFSYQVPPGRYWIVADTFVEGGVPLTGPYTLDITMEEEAW